MNKNHMVITHIKNNIITPIGYIYYNDNINLRKRVLENEKLVRR